MDKLLDLLLLVHDFVLVIFLLVLLTLFPLEILVIFLLNASFLSSSYYFNVFLRGTQRFHFWTKFCILLTLMISWVHLCVSKSWVLKYLPTNPLGSKTQTSLSLVTCRVEVLRWWTWAFMILVLAWSDWDTSGSPYPFSWPSIPRVVLWHLHLLYELSHSLYLMLTCSVKSVHVLTWSS
jgi:hypothetical protein